MSESDIVAELARDNREFIVWLCVDAIGPGLTESEYAQASSDGRYRWSTGVPAFGANEPAALWKPYLMDTLPDLLSERVEGLGGLAELGGLSAQILDVNNELAAVMAPDRAPVAFLTTELQASDGDLHISDPAAFPSVRDYLFIEDEVIAPTEPPDTVFDVRRGVLGTSPATYAAGTPIFAAPPYLQEREIEVFIAPRNAQSMDDAESLGTFRLESLAWDDMLNVWTLSASSALAGLDTAVPAVPRIAEVLSVPAAFNDPTLHAPFILMPIEADTFADHFGSVVSVLGGDEVFRVTRLAGTSNVTVGARGLGNTELGQLKPGDTLRQVFVASRGDFRYSPGPAPSTTRASGVWTFTSHPLEILLCILLSPADEDDAGVDLNFVAERGNYASLPAGYGLGVGATAIDWDSWADVIERTRDFRLPNLVWGARDEDFREWADREVLKPLGAFVSAQDGVLYCHRPQIPLSGTQVDTITVADVLTVGNKPDMRVSRDLAKSPTELGFALGAGGVIRKTQASFRGAGTSVVIPVPGADTRDASWWAAEASARVSKTFLPRTKLDVAVDLRLWNTRLGDYVSVVLPEVPNMAGGRGVNSLAQVLAREVRYSDAHGLHLRLHLELYAGASTTLRVAPAATITATGGTGPYFVVLSAIRYTDGLGSGGLPTRDGAAFQVGDLVELRTAAGIQVIDKTATVTAEGTTTVYISDNFDGLIQSGHRLVVTDRVQATASQRSRYAFTSATAASASLYGDD